MDGLLERDDALARLHASLERVRELDAGEVATVSGEAGAGKSSVLRAFAAGARSAQVLWGACDGLRTPRPLGPLLDLAAAAGGELAAAAADPATRRDALFAAAIDHLATPSQPVIAVVEDAHWADDATLDFLTFLGRRIAATRALLVVSYRDDEVGGRHPLRVVLGDVAASTRERIRLAPLSPGAVAALAAGHDIDPDALHAATGGNAFYVTETLAAGTAGVPDSVRNAVLARAARLGAPARRLLEAVAVVPGRAELWLAEAIAGRDAEAIDECVEGGMLVVDGDHVALRHELARLAVADVTAPARRRGLHRRALAALADPPAGRPDPARLAHHAAEAGDAGAVLAYAPAAAEQAVATGAHREAAAHLEEACRHRDRLPPAEQLPLLSRLADELSLVGRLDESVAAYDAAIECARQLGDRRAEGRLLVKRAGPLTSAGRSPESVASSRAGLEVLEPLGPSVELTEAYASVASEHMLARELPEAIEWSYRAERLATDLGELAVVSHTRIQGGVAELMAGVDGGLERIHSGIGLARELGLDHRVALGWSQIGSGGGEVRRYDVAIPALHECIRIARERDLASNEQYTSSWLARCDLEQGRWDDAGRRATEVLASLRAIGIARFTALCCLGRLRARRGDPGAWEALDEALDLARQTGHLQRLWPVAAARAEAAWLEDRLGAELPAVREVHAMAASLRYPWAVGELGFWRWRAGDLDDLAPDAAEPYRLHAAGRWEEAAAAWRTLGCPYEEADALADSADPAPVRAALAIFESLGARPAADRAARRLRQMGERVARGPNRAARGNPAGMTDREVEVLALVAAGLSNKALAARLGISTKTAGHHVSHILTKLGAANRAEAAAAAQRLGITEAKN